MILKELLALREAAEKKTVVMKLTMDYIDGNDNDKQGSVTVFHTFKTAEEAQAFFEKAKKNGEEEYKEVGGGDDDSLYHYAHNAFNSVSAMHGGAMVSNVKLVAKEPALARKVFSFNPTDEAFTILSEAKKKAPVDHSPLGQLKALPQPIGINGGSYTYWVDVTKTPLKFIASDGSEVDKAKSLEDIAKWMEKWAAEIWLEFLNGDEDLEMLRGENIIRLKKGRTDQQDHEADMRG